MNENQNTQFDNYLDRIEAIEKKERKKKVFYGLAAVLLLGGAAAGFLLWQSSSSALMTYGYKELDTEKVRQLIGKGEAPFAVYHSEMGRDTISTEEDFELFVSMVELMNQNIASNVADFMEEDAKQFEFDQEDPEDERLPVFFVDIDGERSAGSVLTMTIEDYDPSIVYTLLTGNGDRVRLRKETQYTYKYGGDFLLRLYASKQNHRTSVYTKRMEIIGNPAPEEANTSIAATDETPSLPELAENLRMSLDSQRQDSGTEILLASADNDLIPFNDLSFEVEDEDTPEEVPTAEDVSNNRPEREAVDFSKPMFVVDQMPAYPGGVRSMSRYFRKNFRYPSGARESGVDGQVFVRFVVQPDGSLTDITVFRGLGYGCDEEAIRLVRNMPNWEPGIYQGREVAVYKEIPITFQLVE
ncbi:MAG: energy transducer TonB [Bacteroidota bacterium]